VGSQGRWILTQCVWKRKLHGTGQKNGRFIDFDADIFLQLFIYQTGKNNLLCSNKLILLLNRKATLIDPLAESCQFF